MSSNTSSVTLVNDNHMDSYIKEIMAFVYYGSIVNNRPPPRKKNKKKTKNKKQKTEQVFSQYGYIGQW